MNEKMAKPPEKPLFATLGIPLATLTIEKISSPYLTDVAVCAKIPIMNAASLPLDLPYSRQAEKVIARFGGARDLARALAECDLDRHPCNVYRWTYPRTKGGTHGYIPIHALQMVLAAARRNGIYLTQEDLRP